MAMDAPSDVQEFLASRPGFAYVANLFTFTLASGPVVRLTDWRRPLTVGGNVFLPNPRPVRGTLRVERGMVVATQQIELQEPNDVVIGQIARGYFNRAVYKMERMFSAKPAEGAPLAWTSAYTRFAGRVNSIDSCSRTSAKMTVKSLLDDLDNDYPRDVIEPDCDAVLFDEACGLSAVSYQVAGAAAAGSTVNKLLSGLTQADVYFTQGRVQWTSGVMAGLQYMVKDYTGGVVTPAWPFLVAPNAGDTFDIWPGCDKTLATCQSKYGYNPPSVSVAPFFRGAPFVPDPTVTY